MKKFDNRILLSPPHMSGNEMHYIEKAFQENWIVPLGPNVDEFESAMKKYLGKDVYPVAMSSGTSAIHIALRLLGVKEREEVFCSSATFVASANPILYEKAIPVFIDSDYDSYNICPDALEKAIKEKKKSGKVPRILIAVDLFGRSCHYNEIIDICRQYNIELIEDSAESLGSSYKNQKCGTFGKYGVLSFNGNKIITTSGGGMLITHSQEEYNQAVKLITQARDQAPFYLHSEVGYNYRMSNICAGIGIAQLQVLDERVSSRKRNFSLYKENLQSLNWSFLGDSDNSVSNSWLSTALLPKEASYSPQDVINKLNEYNVEARYIWKPLHSQPLFQDNEFFKVQSEQSVADDIFARGICLPSGSSLKVEELEKICNIIKANF